jgi:hypothetical protein
MRERESVPAVGVVWYEAPESITQSEEGGVIAMVLNAAARGRGPVRDVRAGEGRREALPGRDGRAGEGRREGRRGGGAGGRGRVEGPAAEGGRRPAALQWREKPPGGCAGEKMPLAAGRKQRTKPRLKIPC